jgi:hypothetical protein
MKAYWRSGGIAPRILCSKHYMEVRDCCEYSNELSV